MMMLPENVLMRNEDDWIDYAACGSFDPEIFYEKGREKEAVEICRTCPVMAVCYLQSLALKEAWGVWGGTTAPTRRKLLGIKLDEDT